MYPLRDLNRRALLIMKMYKDKALEDGLFDRRFLENMDLVPESHRFITDKSRQLLFSTHCVTRQRRK